MKILFVVESKGKIATLSKILGGNYIVKASNGIFRDLDHKKFSIDVENDLEPIYVITNPSTISTLKSSMKNADKLYIATDLDREGEGIAQSLYDVLRPKFYRRIRFNNITKNTILDAVENAGKIDHDLVAAQKARRVLDRLVGWMISPILCNCIGGKLSAGRVQSVVVKIIVDKENDIKQFIENNSDSTFFKSNGVFGGLKAVLYEKNKQAQIPVDDAKPFIRKCKKSKFVVSDMFTKDGVKNPAPPFSTDTLQQEAARKLRMSSKETMKCAQRLYEAGYITYMRTDSVEISEEGHEKIKKVIENEYGTKYYQKHIYKNKDKHAQEAHECIRPTKPLRLKVDDMGEREQSLYKLVWRRTIASQMKPAKLEYTIIHIDISQMGGAKPYYYYQSQLEKIVFKGFLLVYEESKDDDQGDDVVRDYQGKIPKIGKEIKVDSIEVRQEYKRPPYRYSQASIVKRMKDLKIGRPATYASSIEKIKDYEYVKVDDVKGIKKDVMIYYMDGERELSYQEDRVEIGKEKGKLVPTQVGCDIVEFMNKYFAEIMDYDFTAKMEDQLDQVARGEKDWKKMAKKFYGLIKPKVDELKNSKSAKMERAKKLLGEDEDGNSVYLTVAKWGPVVMKEVGKKKVYGKVDDVDGMTLKKALKILSFPKTLGEYKGKEVVLAKGKHGVYLKYDGNNYGTDGKEVELDGAINVIKKSQSNVMAEFSDGKLKYKVVNGEYGHYVQVIGGKKKMNVGIPKSCKIEELDIDQVKSIVANKPKRKWKGGSKKRRG